MCMLHALHLLRRLLKVRLAVFHFDHRLRADSHKDAAYVERAAAKLKLEFHLRVAESEPAKGESVEDWAHRARLRALVLAMRDADAGKAAIAHTQDDQAETVLIAAIRGGGLDAVAGIRPSEGPFVRPLIDTTRAEAEAFCRALHFRPRVDPTNRDTRLLRNAVRLKVIPQLEKSVGREVKASLARTGSLLRGDAVELQRQAAQQVTELLEEEPEGFALNAAALDGIPRAIATRVIRAALYRLGGLPTAEGVDAVLDLAAGRPGRRRDLPGGLIATRDREYVRVSASPAG